MEIKNLLVTLAIKWLLEMRQDKDQFSVLKKMTVIATDKKAEKCKYELGLNLLLKEAVDRFSCILGEGNLIITCGYLKGVQKHER